MLIVLELTVVRWGWYFNLDYRHTSLQVLWAIGASMILMAPLIVLHSRVVGAIGLTIVALHNAVGPIVRGSAIGESWPWALLYERGRVLTLAPEVSITVNFPVLPLFGIMAMGYAFGETDLDGAGSARAIVLARIHHHRPSANAVLPPSCARDPSRGLYSWTTIGDAAGLFTSPFDRGAVSVPTGWGLGLLGVYASTIVFLVALYPVCRRYANLKFQSRSAWLSYL